jgi:tRNA(Arg) A34 adenosine deaminase TadA/methionine-rich copper-binding protein CopC
MISSDTNIITWSTNLKATSSSIKLKVMDDAGNENAQSKQISQDYTVDTTIPDQVISAITISHDSDSQQGSSSDFITKTQVQTISAKISGPLSDGQRLMARVENGEEDEWSDISSSISLVNGNYYVNWSTNLAEGTNNIEMKVESLAGKSPTTYPSVEYTLDLDAPSQTIDELKLSKDSNEKGDFVTNQALQTIKAEIDSGLNPGEKLYGSINGGATWIEISDKITGNKIEWDNVTLNNDDNYIVIMVEDIAGNTNEILSQKYILDTQKPTTKVLLDSNHDIKFSEDTGYDSQDLYTKEASQEITATLTAQLEDDEKLLARLSDTTDWVDITSYVDGVDIVWNTTLVSGDHKVEFKVKDLAGNDGAIIGDGYRLDTTAITTVPTLDDTIDNLIPESDGEFIVVNNISETKAIAQNGLTNDTTPVVTVKIPIDMLKDDIICIYHNDSDEPIKMYQVTQNDIESGRIANIEIPELKDGEHSIKVSFADLSGNETTQSSEFNFTINTDIPTKTVDNIEIEKDTGYDSDDFITNEASVQEITASLSESLSNGEKLLARVDGGVWEDITSLVNGTTISWDKALVEGSHNIEMKVQSAFGTDGKIESEAYTLDVDKITTVPLSDNDTDITPDAQGEFVILDEINGISRIFDGAESVDATPVIKIKLDDDMVVNDSVLIYDNGVLIQTYRIDEDDISGDRIVSIELDVPLVGGNHPLSVAFEDIAGNQTVESSAVTINVTGTAPSHKIYDVSISSDTGSDKEDFVTKTKNQNIKAKLTEELGVDDILLARVDGGEWKNITSSVNGLDIGWDNVDLEDGFGKIEFRVNTNGQNGELESVDYKLDTTLPTVEIADIVMDDDYINREEQSNVTISGSSTDTEEGSIVTVTISDGENTPITRTAVTDDEGNWNITGLDITGSFNEGTLNITATVDDLAGNTSVADDKSVILDTENDLIANIQYTDTEGPQGSKTDKITKDNFFYFKDFIWNGQSYGTDLEETSTFRYSIDAGTTWINGSKKVKNGHIGFEVNVDGEYKAGDIKIETTDIAGNVGIYDMNIMMKPITVDTQKDIATVSFEEDTGNKDDDQITQNGQINVTGLEDKTSWYYKVKVDGVWSPESAEFTVANTHFILENNVYEDVQIITIDQAGNEYTKNLGPVTIDNQAITTPEIVRIKDDVERYETFNKQNGQSNSGLGTIVTDDKSLEVRVILNNIAENDSVILYIFDGTITREQEYKITRDNAANSFADITLDSTKLPTDGDYTISIKLKDAAGNESNVSTPIAFTLDTKINDFDEANILEDTYGAHVVGGDSDKITSNGRINVTGLDPDTKWFWREDENSGWEEVTTTIVNGNSYIVLDEKPDSEPYKNLQLMTIDKAGNESPITTIGKFVVDQTKDDFSIALELDTKGSHITDGSTDKITSNGTINVDGVTDENSVWYYSIEEDVTNPTNNGKLFLDDGAEVTMGGLITDVDTLGLTNAFTVSIEAFLNEEDGFATLVEKVNTDAQDDFYIGFEKGQLFVKLNGVIYDIGRTSDYVNENHIYTMSYDETNGGTIKFFIDGVLKESFTSVGGFTSSNEGKLVVGADIDFYPHVTDSPFSGEIDNLQIYSKALSDAEITQMIAGTTQSDLVVHYDMNLPEPFKNKAGENYDVEAFGSARVKVDNWIMGTGTSFELPEGEYDKVRVKSVDIAGNEEIHDIKNIVVDQSDEIVRMTLKDDSSAEHIIGGEYDQISKSDIIEISNDSGFVFDGNNAILAGDEVNRYNTEFTISVDVAYSGNGGIIFNKENSYEMRVAEDGTISFALRQLHSAGWEWIETEYKINKDVYTNLTFTYDGEKQQAVLYANGESVYDSKNYSNHTIASELHLTNHELMFGKRVIGDGDFFEGKMDNIKVFTSHLEADDVKNMADGKKIPYSARIEYDFESENPFSNKWSNYGTNDARVFVKETILLGSKNEKGDISDWGTPNPDGTLNIGIGNVSGRITAYDSNGAVAKVAYENDLRDYGLGVSSSKDDKDKTNEVELNQKLVLEFDSKLSNATIGLDSLYENFTPNPAQDAKVKWVAYGEDGSIVDQGEIQNGEGTDTDNDGLTQTQKFTVNGTFTKIELETVSPSNMNANFTIRYIEANAESIVDANDRISTIDGMVSIEGLGVLDSSSVWYYKHDGMSDWQLGTGNQFSLGVADDTEQTFTNVEVKTIDAAGNDDITTMGTVVIDKLEDDFIVKLHKDTAGHHITDGGSDKISMNGQIDVIGVNDIGSRWYYSIDDGATWIRGLGDSFVLSEGHYEKVLVKSVDKAGNEEEIDFGSVTVGQTGKNFALDLEDDTYGTFRYGQDSVVTTNYAARLYEEDTALVLESDDFNFTNAFSISANVYLDSDATNVGILFNKENSYEMRVDPDGSIHYALQKAGGANWWWVDTGFDIDVNKYTNLTFTFDGETKGVKLYADGQEVYSEITHVDTLAQTSNPLMFGQRGYQTNPFEGKIDDIKIYSDTLDAKAVSSIAKGEDVNPQGVYVNTSATDQGLKVDSTGDKAELLGGATSIDMSINFNSSDTTSSAIVSYTTPSTDNEFLLYSENNGHLTVYISGISVDTGIDTTDLFDGVDHDLRVVWDSDTGNVSVYVDGVKKYSGNVAKGETIEENGSLIFGQEQDTVGGGFSIMQTFSGKYNNISISTDGELKANWELGGNGEDIFSDTEGNFDFEIIGATIPNGDSFNLVGAYDFEGDNPLADKSGNNNDMIVQTGKAIAFNQDGNNQTLKIDSTGDKPELFGGASELEFTISVKVEPNDVSPSYSSIVSYASEKTHNDFLVDYTQVDGNTRVDVYIGGSSISFEANKNLQDGEYHDVKVLWLDGQVTLIVDGENLGSQELGNDYTLGENGVMVLGQEQDSVNGSFDTTQFAKMSVDDLRIETDTHSSASWKMQNIKNNMVEALEGSIDLHVINDIQNSGTANTNSIKVVELYSTQSDEISGVIGDANGVGTYASGETIVNSVQTGNQYFVEMASLSDGGYVSVWQSGSDIFANRYDAEQKLVTTFQVDEGLSGSQSWPQVTELSNGNYVVQWVDSDDGTYSARAFIIDESTNKPTTSTPITIDSHTAGGYSGTVAPMGNGGFISTWSHYGQDSHEMGVGYRIFDANGNALIDEKIANTETSANQQHAEITALDNGNAVIVWKSYGQDGSENGIYSQIISASGTKEGQEIQVNVNTTGSQQWPNVTTLSNGDYVVTWTDNSDDTVRARRFAEDGRPLSDEIIVNTTATDGYDDHYIPEVSELINGGFVIAYQAKDGIYAQMFNNANEKAGNEISVSEHFETTDERRGNMASLTTLKDGSFIVAWNAQTSNGNHDIIQRVFDIDTIGESLDISVGSDSDKYTSNGTVVISDVTADGTIIGEGITTDSDVVWFYRYNNGEWNEGSGSSFDLPPNEKYVNVQVMTVDTAGNKVTHPLGTIIVDTLADTFEIDFIDSKGGTAADNDHITNDTSIAVKGVETSSMWLYKYDGIHWTYGGKGSGTFRFPGDGEYKNIQFKTIDRAGNELEESEIKQLGDWVIDTTIDDFVTVLLDDTKGEHTGQIGDQITSSGVIDVKGVTDDNSIWQYSINGQNWVTGTGSAFELDEGSYTNVKVRSIDHAGNVSPEYNYGTITVDKSADIFNSVLVDTAGGFGRTDDNYTKDNVIKVSDVESGSAVYYRVDDESDWIYYGKDDQEIKLADGVYSNLAVRTVDVAGNEQINTIGWRHIDTKGDDLTVSIVDSGQDYENIVNKDREGDQFFVEMATLKGAGYVSVWASDGNIFANRYDLNNNLVKTFQIDEGLSGSQSWPQVTELSNGNYLIQWNETADGLFATKAKIYNGETNQETEAGVITLDSNSTGGYWDPIAPMGDGGFIATWSHWGQDGDGVGVGYRIFNADGTPKIDAKIANTYTSSHQAHAEITALDNGNAVIVWKSYGQDGSEYGIYSQIINPEGEKVLSSDIQVNQHTEKSQQWPNVTTLTNGDYVVTWTNASDDSVRARRFNEDGTAVSDEIIVNTTGTDGNDHHYIPEVTALENGGFVIAYQAIGGIYAQIFDASSKKVHNEIEVSDYYEESSEWRGNMASLTTLDDGGFLVAWNAKTPDGAHDIIQKRYSVDANNGYSYAEVTGVNNDLLTKDGRITIKDVELLSKVYYKYGTGDWIEVTSKTSSDDVAYFKLNHGVYNSLYIKTVDHVGNPELHYIGDYEVDEKIDEFRATLVDTGSKDNDGITNDNTLEVKGLELKSAGVGTRWYYQYNDGSWIYGGTGDGEVTLSDGVYNNLKVKSVDLAGNEHEQTVGSGSFVIDTKGDEHESKLLNDTAGGRGTDNDNISRDGTIRISGIAQNEGKVQYTYGDSGKWIDITGGQDDGVIEFKLAQGTYTNFITRTIDLAGNSHENPIGTIIIDTDADAFKIIDLNDTNDKPSTTNPTPTIDSNLSGVGAQNKGVSSINGNQNADIKLLNTNSNMEIIHVLRKNGEVYKVLHENIHSSSHDSRVDFDEYRDFSLSASVNGSNVLLSGYSEPKSDVKLYLNGNYWLTVKADEHGQWTYTASTTWFNRGSSVSINAQGYDENGNQSDVLPGVSFRGTRVPNYDPITELEDGGYVVTWSADTSADARDDSGFGVFGQRYDADGKPVGGSFQVNTTEANNQLSPDVVGLNDGGYVVVWETENASRTSWEIFSQRYDANGNRVGTETIVNGSTTGDQSAPTITNLNNGGYAITWQGDNGDGNLDIYIKVYNENGVHVGTESIANTITHDSQEIPQITTLENGNFVVVWQSFNPTTNTYSVAAQQFTASGAKVGTQINIVKQDMETNDSPYVEAFADGGFIISWLDANDRTFNAQTFTDAGVPSSEEKTLGTFGTNGTNTAEIAQNGTGFVTALNDEGNIRIKSFNAEFEQISEVVIDKSIELREPHITELKDGGFVVTWSEVVHAGSIKVVGQKFDAFGVAVTDEFDVGQVRDFNNLDEYEIETIVYNPNAGNSQSFVTGFENQDGKMVLSDTTKSTSSIKNDDFHVAGKFTSGSTIELNGLTNIGESAVIYIYNGNTLQDTIIKDCTNGGFWNESINVSSNTKIQIVSVGTNSQLSAKEFVMNGSYSSGNIADFKEIDISTTPGYLDVDEVIVFSDMEAPGIEVESIDSTTSWEYKTDAGASWTYGGTGNGTINLKGHYDSLYVKTIDRAGNEYTKEYKDVLFGKIFSGAETNSGNDNWLSASGYAKPYSTINVSGSSNGTAKADENGNWKYSRYLGSMGRGWKSVTFKGIGDDDKAGEFTVSEEGFDPIASLEDGGYVVTYASNVDERDGDGFGTYAQRYNADGSVYGEAVLVNTTLEGNQINSDVTGLDDGGYVVVWQNEVHDGTKTQYEVYAQRFDANNNSVGSETLINTTTEGMQLNPEITSLSNGGYVVVWQGEETNNLGFFDIYVQVFDASGNRVSSETVANTTTEGSQAIPQISSFDDGSFVVIWESFNIDSKLYEVTTQRFDANGVKLGIENRISKDNMGENSTPFVTTMNNGGYVISWVNTNTVDVVTQTFDVNGVATSEEIVVDALIGNVGSPEVAAFNNGYVVTYLENNDVKLKVLDEESNEVKEIELDGEANRTEPHITELKDGGFLVTWSDVTDSGNRSVFGQRFDKDANKVGEEFAVGKVTEVDDSVLVLDSEYANIDFDSLAAAANSEIAKIDASKGNYILEDVKLEDVITLTDDSNDLIFVGDNGDEIDLSNNEEWVKSEEKTKVEGEEGEFFTYTNTKDPTAKLFIDDDIDVI